MEKELQELIKSAKDFKENQSIGNGAKLNVAIENAEQALSLGVVSERLSSEGEILQWLYLNTPFAIKPKSKHAKTLLVNPFTSNHAFEEVCKQLANKLYNAR